MTMARWIDAAALGGWDARRRLVRAARARLSDWADAWAPRPCVLCEMPLAASCKGLCEGCLDDLPGRDRPRCPRCALSLPDDAPVRPIPSTRRHPSMTPADSRKRGDAVADAGAETNAGAVARAQTDAGAVASAQTNAGVVVRAQRGADAGAQGRAEADARPSRCPQCALSTPAFDAAWTLADYAPPIDRALVVAKFHGQWPLLRALGEALAQEVARDRGRHAAPAPSPTATDGAADRPVVVPIPLSLERLGERGYNQAAIVAQAIAREQGWPLALRRLQRVRHTAAQSALHRDEREANLRDAFRCSGGWQGATIALVDDVMTTGATLAAATRALREAGAGRVEVYVIARTPPPADAAGTPAHRRSRRRDADRE